MTNTALIVLAAGQGTRMKSDIPKVLHKVAGRTLLGHVLSGASPLAAKQTVVVVGPEMEAVGEEAQRYVPGCTIAIQTERKGTGHAVLAARESLANFSGIVVVLCGDAPLINADSIAELLTKINEKTPMAVMGFEPANPFGYGRMIKGDDDTIIAIHEERDATPEEKATKLCNSGIIAVKSDVLWEFLPQVKNKNAKNEYYLTDLAELIARSCAKVGYSVCPEAEVEAVNDRLQLASVEATLQAQYRRGAMLGGATLVAPDTVYFSADTRIGQDVTIEPNVFFGPGVTIGDRVQIMANSHIEGSSVAAGTRIGPFARLRPGAQIGEDAHIGNFVEVKKSKIGRGAKVNHLSYIGDANVGAETNIGAGTITCNYDGFEKHLTDIGANVFVGSNTALVAPVKVGKGANIAAGSVITSDVPADALAITRPELNVKEGWAARYRKMKQARKAAAKKD